MATENSAAMKPDAITERYPWHAATWASLARQFDRLPHALMLYGRPGLGKHAFALQLAQALLCAQPRDAVACGACHGCRLLAAGTHPDLALIGLVEDAKNIMVDQVRALGEFLSLRPHTAARKVVVISPAEAMNINAANSLLKLLEEPPLGSILLLVTSHPARLPATIRSRCRRILFKMPAREAGLGWLRTRPGINQQETLLELAGGAPLMAESLAQDDFLEIRARMFQDLEALRTGREEPVACAARWKSLGIKRCLSWLYSFMSDLIKMRAGGESLTMVNPDVVSHLKKNINKYEISKLYNYIDVIHENYRRLGGPLDELLILEDVLIRWAQLSRLQ